MSGELQFLAILPAWHTGEAVLEVAQWGAPWGLGDPRKERESGPSEKWSIPSSPLRWGALTAEPGSPSLKRTFPGCLDVPPSSHPPSFPPTPVEDSFFACLFLEGVSAPLVMSLSGILTI